ncbi:MAG TPA: hypothetical protein PLT66_05535, partial [Bacillota bacterium]|nr:hypothetical protein [Bacillota bacterium]
RGIAVCDKRIILFGGEKNVSIFTSDPDRNTFCPHIEEIDCSAQSTLPVAVIEAAAPICLDAKIIERSRPFGTCCCAPDAIPETVSARFGGQFVDGHGTNRLFVTIGMFTVVRLERPVQLLIPSCSYCLPDKDSKPAGCGNDPCSVFSQLGFPMNEFFPFSEPGGPEIPPQPHSTPNR